MAKGGEKMSENEILSADYSRAFRLNRHIKIHAELAQQSLYEVCKGLKEMRDDKLYKELNYKNFEEYCEKEIGLKRSQAYKFISIVDNLSENFVQSTAQIGTEKLSILAKLDEPQREEIVQNTDLETVTVKKLKEKIKELENQIKELENRPIEVAVEKDTAEIERLTEQLEQEREAHKEEIDRIKTDKSNDKAILSEIEAYKKVAENSLHNLLTAILRQNTFSRKHMGEKAIEILDKYIKLFRFEDDIKE